MRVIIQRVSSSQVRVGDRQIGKIGRGLNLLVGIAGTDTEAEVDWMVRKCLNLRLFPPKITPVALGTLRRGDSGGNSRD